MTHDSATFRLLECCRIAHVNPVKCAHDSVRSHERVQQDPFLLTESPSLSDTCLIHRLG